MEILWKEFKPIALVINQIENRHTTLIAPFCMFSMSTFHSKGHSQNLFHLRNIQKDVTVNSDLDRRIQKFCFGEGRVGISI